MWLLEMDGIQSSIPIFVVIILENWRLVITKCFSVKLFLMTPNLFISWRHIEDGKLKESGLIRIPILVTAK